LRDPVRWRMGGFRDQNATKKCESARIVDKYREAYLGTDHVKGRSVRSGQGMRILLINSLYPPIQHGGAEVSVSLLAEGLIKQGNHVAVISLHPGREELSEIRNGVRVYRLPLDNLFWPFTQKEKPVQFLRLAWHVIDMWNWRAARRVGRILDAEKPDVVHTNNIAGFSVAVWREVKKRGIRLVHTLRDYYLVCARSTLFRDGNACTERCLRCKLLTAHHQQQSLQVDSVVSVSQFVLNAHTKEQWFEGVQSSVIFNIADSNSECSSSSKEDSTLVLGFIGRIEHEKGIEILLRATQLFSGSNWRLKIAGSGVKSYVAKLQFDFPDTAIEWLGYSNPQEFYGSIDVNIVSSVWPEPMSRAVIETFAAGKSAICADSGGIPEVASFGKVVKMYPARDPQALADIVNDALSNVSTWRDGGFLDHASNTFSERNVVNLYRAVYEDGPGLCSIENLHN
jgi:glycosyltransferase involved in cell wall biosynthesis